MTAGAHVGSIEAMREFRAALHTFIQEAREALGSHDFEVQRSLDWLLESEPERWQQEVRKCEDAVTQARLELERCRNSTLSGGGPPSCMVEKKALERARQRHQYAQDKVRLVRKWGNIFEREVVESRGRVNQFGMLLDVGLPQAIVALDRALTALESYMAMNPHAQSQVATRMSTFDAQTAAATTPSARQAASDESTPSETSSPTEQEIGDRPGRLSDAGAVETNDPSATGRRTD